MKIRTQNGFWGSIFLALFFAAWLAAAALARAHQGGVELGWRAFAIFCGVIFLFFIWPAIKNFIIVLHAATRHRKAERDGQAHARERHATLDQPAHNGLASASEARALACRPNGSQAAD